jgi:hypothetical protein
MIEGKNVHKKLLFSKLLKKFKKYKYFKKTAFFFLLFLYIHMTESVLFICDQFLNQYQNY